MNTTQVFENQDFIGMYASDYIENGRKEGLPVSLWANIWMEHEICCLFARTNVGKSVMAVQIANEVAGAGKRVLYLDFELSPQQFASRYVDTTGTPTRLDPRLIIATLSAKSQSYRRMSDYIDRIEEFVLSVKADALVIDNLTALCFTTECADSASELMSALKALCKRRRLSILLIGHTPKIEEGRPLELTNLAGSMRLANLMDAAFSMGRGFDSEGNEVRYIKHLKARSSALAYDENNVAVFTLETNPLRFKFVRTAPEYILIEKLRPETDPGVRSRFQMPSAEKMERLRSLIDSGAKATDICSQLHISPNKLALLRKML